jgi:hypothetical protein
MLSFGGCSTRRGRLASTGGSIRTTLGSTVHSFPSTNSDTSHDGKVVNSGMSFNAAGTIARLYLGGNEHSSVTTTTAPADFGDNPYFTVGTSLDLNTGESFDGEQSYFYVFAGEILPIEFKMVAANAWGPMFAPQEEWLWLPSSSPAGPDPVVSLGTWDPRLRLLGWF